MRLGRRHLIASLVLLGASILWNVWVFTQPDDTRRPRTAQSGDQPPLLGPPAASGGAPRGTIVDPMSIPPPPPLDLTQQPVWMRNPFAPSAPDQPAAAADVPAPAAPVVAQPVVAVILFSADGRHSAIIDGKAVGVGDRVQDAVVISIARDAVTLQRPSGERLRLPLRSSGPGESFP